MRDRRWRAYYDPEGGFTPFNGKVFTGDFAEVDEQNRLKILGKVSDRITTVNGLNYNPLPFEEEDQALDLDRQSQLDEVIVIGDGQPRLGAVFSAAGGGFEWSDGGLPEAVIA